MKYHNVTCLKSSALVHYSSSNCKRLIWHSVLSLKAEVTVSLLTSFWFIVNSQILQHDVAMISFVLIRRHQVEVSHCQLKRCNWCYWTIFWLQADILIEVRHLLMFFYPSSTTYQVEILSTLCFRLWNHRFKTTLLGNFILNGAVIRAIEYRSSLYKRSQTFSPSVVTACKSRYVCRRSDSDSKIKTLFSRIF